MSGNQTLIFGALGFYLVQANPGVVGDSDDQVIRFVVQDGGGETVEEKEGFEG